MNRRFFLGAAAATLAMPHVARAQAVRELRFASVNATGSVQEKGLMRFKEVVETRTNGAIVVTVYLNSQLGDLAQIASGLQLGTIDLTLYGFGNLAPLAGGQPINVAFVPYLFRDKVAAQKTLGGPIFGPGQLTTWPSSRRRVAPAVPCGSVRVSASQVPVRPVEESTTW